MMSEMDVFINDIQRSRTSKGRSLKTKMINNIVSKNARGEWQLNLENNIVRSFVCQA